MTTSTPTPVPLRPVSAEPMHPCVRCGRPISLDASMCEDCNPLGLSQPATSQAHGTVFLAIAAAVVLLAVAGKVALSGIGPFRGEVSAVQAAEGGLSVSLTVHNQGTKAGSTTCRVTEASRHGTGPAAVLLSPKIDPGGSLTFSMTVAQFGPSPQPLAVECQSP